MIKYMNISEDEGDRMTLDVSITLLKPYSQGTLWVWRREDGSYQAKMNPSYLSDRRDVDSIVSGGQSDAFTDFHAKFMFKHIFDILGIRFSENLLRSQFMKNLGAKLVYPSFPNCTSELLTNQTFPISDNYWKCTLRHLATSGHHVTSTAPLGEVVDEHLT